jgi:hypothetical protein
MVLLILQLLFYCLFYDTGSIYATQCPAEKGNIVPVLN